MAIADAGMLSSANRKELDAAGPRFIVGSCRAKAALLRQNRVARSFNSYRYFLGAAMLTILPGHEPPANPG